MAVKTKRERERERERERMYLLRLENVSYISPIKQFFSLLYSVSLSNASPAKTRHGFEPRVGFAFCNETSNIYRLHTVLDHLNTK